MADRVYDEASSVAAEAGVVLVEGPEGLVVALTPRAAKETAERLSSGGDRAQQQREGRAPPIEPGRPSRP